jgi:hypothetical protein
LGEECEPVCTTHVRGCVGSELQREESKTQVKEERKVLVT